MARASALTVDPAIADEIVGHQVDLLRLSAGERARVLRLLNEMQAELTNLLHSGTLTSFNKARVSSLLRQSGETIDGYYTRIQGQMEETLRGISATQASHISVLLSTEAALPSDTFLERIVANTLIHGAPSADWWSRQSKNLQFKFSNAVRQGIASGDTNEAIVTRVAGSVRNGIPGIMDTARADARALVQTSVQTVANASRLETFRRNPGVVKGLRQVSTLDSHTTDICVAYDDSEWDLDGKPINGTVLPFTSAGGSADGVPRHWGCRSVLVPITKTFEELGINVPEPKRGPRASAGGPTNASMEQWLSRRTVAQQDEQLGAGRAQMWRNGDITLEQLLDLRGNPLSLAQLQRRYGGGP